MSHPIRHAATAADMAQARALFEEYAAWLTIDLGFQGFAEELAGLPGAYAPPRGRLLLAGPQDAAVGCIALRPLDLVADDGGPVAEVKRLYVQPEARGEALGARLAQALLAEADAIGYRALMLDTLEWMTPARSVVRAPGLSRVRAVLPQPASGRRLHDARARRLTYRRAVYLSETDKQAIEARVAALEAASGVEIVTMIVGKADVYPEIVWKAFALGASLAGLAVSVCELLSPAWTVAGAALVDALVILGAGAVCAVLTLYVPAFARLFLRQSRAELEVRQYAEMQFLAREMFATPDRTAILLLTSLLEHRIVLLPDRGMAARVAPSAWDAVIARMTPLLRSRETAAAVLAGLDAIGEILAAKGFRRGEGGNRFPDHPVEVRAP